MWSDRFGFLPEETAFEFTGGEIKLLPGFAETRQFVHDRSNRDGFAYPQQSVTATTKELPPRYDDSSAWEEIPRTSRPSLLGRLPASHEIVLRHQPATANCRTSDGGFIVHLLGHLYGVRLQFADWWLDMRIPTERTRGAFVTTQDAIEFVSTAYKTWQQWSAGAQMRMTNALYMDARSPCYEWDWERFAMNYMVFDALYKMAVECFQVKNARHHDRFAALAERFGLARNHEEWERIYKLRNELFHEAMWDGTHPCTDSSSGAFYAAMFLRSINHRLVPAILQFETKYVGSPWWIFDRCAFVER